MSVLAALPPHLQALLSADRVVHEPTRLALLLMLSEAEDIEFKFFEQATGLTRGNLATHLSKLEEAGYIEVIKSFRGKIPVTRYRLTRPGRHALQGHRNLLASLTTQTAL